MRTKEIDTEASVMHIADMKTISLSDEAYNRLAAWKESAKESFSAVVLKVVPKRGTLGDFAVEMDRLPPLTEEQAATVEEAIRWANDWRNQADPWTTSPTRRS